MINYTHFKVIIIGKPTTWVNCGKHIEHGDIAVILADKKVHVGYACYSCWRKENK